MLRNSNSVLNLSFLTIEKYDCIENNSEEEILSS